MIIEQRIYQLETDAIPRYFEALGQAGFDMQVARFGRCTGHYVTEIGPHSQVIALWEHSNFEARQEGRRRLRQEPEWVDIMARVSPLIRSIDTKLLIPSPVWNNRDFTLTP